jgi:hypothetical protein
MKKLNSAAKILGSGLLMTIVLGLCPMSAHAGCMIATGLRANHRIAVAKPGATTAVAAAGSKIQSNPQGNAVAGAKTITTFPAHLGDVHYRESVSGRHP